MDVAKILNVAREVCQTAAVCCEINPQFRIPSVEAGCALCHRLGKRDQAG